MVQYALKDIPGIRDLELVGGQPVKPKGQLIQYRGTTKAADVIAALHNKTTLRAEVARAPRLDRSEPNPPKPAAP